MRNFVKNIVFSFCGLILFANQAQSQDKFIGSGEIKFGVVATITWLFFNKIINEPTNFTITDNGKIGHFHSCELRICLPSSFYTAVNSCQAVAKEYSYPNPKCLVFSEKRQKITWQDAGDFNHQDKIATRKQDGILFTKSPELGYEAKKKWEAYSKLNITNKFFIVSQDSNIAFPLSFESTKFEPVKNLDELIPILIAFEQDFFQPAYIYAEGNKILTAP